MKQAIYSNSRAFLLVVWLFWTPQIWGQVLHVKAGVTEADGESWNTATTLIDALDRAQSGDRVWVAAGTYKPTAGTDRNASFRIQPGVTVYGGFPADADDATGMAERNWIEHITTLSGDIGELGITGDNTYHVLHTLAGAADLEAVVDGVVVRDGTAVHYNSLYRRRGGGGHFSGKVRLSRCTFTNNFAAEEGGAIYATAELTVTNCTFTANSTSAQGGAIYSSTSVTIAGSTFSDNVARSAGGLWLDAAATLDGCIFTNNTTTLGGGGGVVAYGATVTDCRFANNSGRSGGGLFLVGGSVNRSVFAENVGSQNGGGCYLHAYATIHASTFEGNQAGAGGGLYAYAGADVAGTSFLQNTAQTCGAFFSVASDARTTLTNSQFRGNTESVSVNTASLALLYGEASVVNCLFNDDAEQIIWATECHAEFTNCTFTDTSISNPGTRFSFDRVTGTMANCIIGNASVNEPMLSGLTLSNNFLYETHGSGGPGFVDRDGLDDILGTADDDLRLNVESPCIDRGARAHYPGDGPATDLAGLPRFVDDKETLDLEGELAPVIDIGAYEYYAAPVLNLAETQPDVTFLVGIRSHMAIADLNGDGVSDPVIHSYTALNSFFGTRDWSTVYDPTGRNGYSPDVYLKSNYRTVLTYISHPRLVDWDQDGFDDLPIDDVLEYDPLSSQPLNPHIVWGSPSLGGTIDLAAPAPTIQVTTFTDTWQGAYAATFAADMDGDGTNDLILNSRDGESPPASPAPHSSVRIVFNPALHKSLQEVDLTDPAINSLTLFKPSPGLVALGAADLQGDDSDNLIISKSGEDAYIIDAKSIYGQLVGPQRVDLVGDPVSGVIPITPNTPGTFTKCVVGDFNGDGFEDAALLNDTYAPSDYVCLLFGRSDPLAPIDFSAEDLSPDRGVVIHGFAEQSRFEVTLEAGDFNADGFDDLAIGGKPVDASTAGGVYLILGGEAFPAELDLQAPANDPPRVLSYTTTSDDALGAALAQGDANADGIPDLLVGAPYAGASDHGQALLFYGRTSWGSGAQLAPDVRVEGVDGEELTGIGHMIIADINGDATGDLLLQSRRRAIALLSNSSQPADSLTVTGNGFTIWNGQTATGAADGTDFGSLQLGESASQNFVVYNRSAATIEVTIASSEYSVEPTTLNLAVGESSSVTLSFSPNRTGSFRDTITLSYGPPADTSEFTFVANANAVELLGEVARHVGTGESDLGMALAVAQLDEDDPFELLIGSPGHNSDTNLDIGRVSIPDLDSGVTYDGDTAEGYFGRALAAIDLDGIDGFVVGAPGVSKIAIYTPDGNGSFQSTEITKTDDFGHALATGYFNDDPYADLVVSSRKFNGGRGAIWVYFGTDTGWPGEGEMVGLGSGQAGDWFGNSLAAGDVNGDNRPDIVVGAPGTQSGRVGQVLVYTVDPADNSISLIKTFTGTATEGWFGYAVTTVQLALGDPQHGILIGSPYRNGPAGEEAGAAYLHVYDKEGQSWQQRKEFLGAQPYARLGWAVAEVGDVDKNKVPDLAIGIPYNSGSTSDPGQVHVYSVNGTFVQQLTGDSNDYLGAAIVGGQDLDGDTVDDIAAGATNATSRRREEGNGAVIVYGGAQLKAAISGSVWADTDDDGVRDTKENGWANIPVQLLDADDLSVLQTTTTDDSGQYQFTGLDAGNYQAAFSLPDMHSFSPPFKASQQLSSDVQTVVYEDPNYYGRTRTLSLALGDSAEYLDAGIRPPGAIVYVNSAATGADDGSSWDDARRDLTAALADALPGQVLWVATGHYRAADQDGFVIPARVTVIGAFAGTERPSTQRDPLTPRTILSGDVMGNDAPDFNGRNDNAQHVVTIAGNDVYLDGFEIRGGESDGDGGGVLCLGNATIANCTLTDNQADRGGAIASPTHDVTIRDCEIRHNRASHGGAILLAEQGYIANCQLYDNTGVWGSALYASQPTTGMPEIVIVSSLFVRNWAILEGAIYNHGANLDVRNCTFASNTNANNRSSIYYGVGAESIAYFGNSILSGNNGLPLIGGENTPDTSATYCLVQEPFLNNLVGDPLFVDADADDYRLRPDSPAHDRGAPMLVPHDTKDLDGDGNIAERIDIDLAGNPRRVVEVDLGAYETTPANTVIYVNQNAVGDNDGSTWEHAYVSLSDALANSAADNQIWVAEGDYTSPATTSFTPLQGQTLYGGFVGTEADATSREQPTTLDGGGTIDILVEISAPGVTIDGFRLRGGVLNGIRCDGVDDSVRIANCTLSDNGNIAGGHSAAIWCQESSPLITDCLITANRSSTHGAGISSEGGNTTLIVRDCELRNNTGGLTGAIYLALDTVARIEDCIFVENEGHQGGAIRVASGLVPTVITGCRFTNNNAQDDGGGIGAYSPLELSDCIFEGNTAVMQGGGLHLENTTVAVANCEFRNNTTGSGGGIGTEMTCNLRVVDTSLTANTANASGAGINFSYGVLEVDRCRFEGNDAQSSGGALNVSSGTITVANSLFSDNLTALDGAACALNGPFSGEFLMHNCTLQNNDLAVITGDTHVVNTIFVNTANGALRGQVDELFHCLFANNPDGDYFDGTSTHTGAAALNALAECDAIIDTPPTFDPDFRLMARSSGIDAGNSAALPADALDFDRRPRFVDDPDTADTGLAAPPVTEVVDIGAYEYRPLDDILYVDHTATGLNNGLTWEDAYPSLDDALDKAVAGQAVHIADGDYLATTSFRPASGVTLLGGFGGETRLLAESWQIIVILEEVAGVTLEQLTLQGAQGGLHALWLFNATANDNLVSNCRFIDNSAESGALGITNGHLTVRDSYFSGNSSNNASGGAINCQFQATVEVSGCEFHNNMATHGGGALYAEGDLLLTDSIFSGNNATDGGAIHLYQGSNNIVRDCQFLANTAITGGNALHAGSQSGDLLISGCLFDGNGVEGYVAANFGFTITERANVYRNHGPNQDVWYQSVGSLHMANSIFHRNNSQTLLHNQATATVVNCTFADNTVSTAIIQNDSTLDLSNSIFWGNTGDLTAGTIGGSHNLLQDADPLFADAANADYHILPGTPAFDTGNTAALMGLVSEDFDGTPRVRGANVDIGAYERPFVDATVFSDSTQRIGSESSFGVALARLDANASLDAFTVTRHSHLDNGNNFVRFNDGNGVFTDSGQRLGDQNSAAVALGDLNGDGHLDAFVANDHESANGAPNRVWFGDGAGTFVDSGQRLGTAESSDVALAYINDDQHLDAVVSNGVLGTTTGANELWLNDGAGQFVAGPTFGNAESAGLAVGDLDGDGDPDVFVTNAAQPNTVWRNDDGVLVNTGQALGVAASNDVSLGDLNGDGSLDAFVANASGQPNTVWLNQGDGTFVASGQAIGSSSSRAVALGDLDGDGRLDAFVGNLGTEPDVIWINTGNGLFVESQHIGASYTWDVGLGDLDGDGDLDAYLAKSDTGGGPDEVWFNQTPPAIYVDLNAPGPVHDGRTWETAYLTIQEGVYDHRANGRPVHVADGLYSESVVLLDNRRVVGGFGGDTRVHSSGDQAALIIHQVDGVSLETLGFQDIGPYARAAAITCNLAPDAVAELVGCTFRSCSSEFGAVTIGSGLLVVRDCSFSDNRSEVGSGGALNCTGTSARLEVHDSTFSNNWAVHGGGAINCGAGSAIYGSTFTGNEADEGGAIYAHNATDTIIDTCEFTGNTANWSGAILYGRMGTGQTTVQNSTFARNHAGDATAIGVYDMTVNIYACTFNGLEDGPGTSGPVSVVHNSVGTINIEGCLFRDHDGSGVISSDDSTTVVNCTITDNTSTNATLYTNGGTIDVHNSIVYGNTSPAATNGTVSDSHSILENQDPLLLDSRPRPGSPAIDSGNSARASLATDLDRNPRILGASVDMGAYELQANFPADIIADSTQRIGTSASNAVALGLLNDDTLLDAFTATQRSHLDDGANLVWFGKGDGSFTDSGQRLGFQNSASVALGLINDDPYLDAVVANDHESPSGAPNRVWWGSADGTFTDSGARLGDGETIEVALVDLDGDNDLDLLFANGVLGTTTGANEIWINNNGSFSSGGTFGNAESTGIDAGDTFVYVTNASQPNTIWEIVGDGTLRLAAQTTAANYSQDSALGDLDGDGDLDIVVANRTGQPDMVYFNEGNFVFRDSGQRLAAFESRTVSLGDLNGDGFLDAFFGSILDDPSTIWYNDGTGHFYDSGQRIGSGFTFDVGLGDLDGDGDLDAYLAKGSTGGEPDEVWINNWPRIVFVDQNAPGPIHDGLTWDTAHLTIQEGVDDPRAYTLPVHVADGNYAESVTVPANRHIIGSFGGQTLILPPRDQAALLLDDVDRVRIEDLHIDGVDSANINAPITCQLASDASAELIRCSVRDSGSLSGAVSIDGGLLIVRDCSFSGNRSEIGSGGALNCFTWTDARLEVYDSTFNENWAANGGGAINWGVDSIITGSTFTNNQANEGGAIYADNATDTLIDQCHFEGNIATWGGAIFYGRAGSGETTVQQSTFVGNHAGDAMAIGVYDMTVNINACIFDRHEHSDGPSGPVPVIHNSVGTVRAEGCLLHDNNGSGVISSEDQTTVVNCTIVDNTSSRATLYTTGNGTINVHNTIVYENNSPTPTDGTVTDSHSILENQDPLLVDYRPLPGSPAIDSGNNAVVSQPTDLDGNPRVIGARVDMGAYELQVDFPADMIADSGQRIGSAASFAVALALLDGDEILDAFVATRRSHLDSGANLVLLGNGDAGFTDSGQQLGFQNSGSVALGLINDDPYLDAVIANDHESPSGAPNRVWWGSADGTFTDSGARLGNAETGEVALLDLDGDNDLDLLFANGVLGTTTGANEIWLNDNGSFSSGGTFGDAESSGIAAGPGFVFVTNANQPNTIWQTVGDGTLAPVAQTVAANYSQDVALGDLDGDGDLDAMVANSNGQPDTVYFNDGNYVFRDSGQRLGAFSSRTIALGDLNGDGFLDAYIGSIEDQPDTIWYNNGSGYFYDSGQRIGGGWTWDVALGDLDGDGDLDAYLAKGSTGGAPDEVWINTWPRAVFVDQNAPGPIHDGLSWDTAYRTIQDAIDDPRGNATPIHVAEGNYGPFVLTAARQLIGGFASPSGSGGRDSHTPTTTIDGAGTADVVVHIDGATGVTLDSFIIRGGVHNGIRCDTIDAELTITRCLITENGSTDTGGGVLFAGGGELTIDRCRFIENNAASGGALYAEQGTIRVANSLFNANTATSGGVVALNPFTGQFVMVNCTVAFNSATAEGGGLAVSLQTPQSDARIINSILVNNTPESIHGKVTEISHTNFYHSPVDYDDGVAQHTGKAALNALDECDAIIEVRNLFDEQFRPRPFTPVTDAGRNDAVFGDLDLDGNARRSDVSVIADTGTGTAPIVDMGAYEAIGDAAITGRVWLDVNHDGRQDPSELSLPGERLNLRDGDANLLSEIVTEADGTYTFNALPAGDYRVEFIPFPRELLSRHDAAPDDLDSDPHRTDGMTPVLTLAAGQTLTHVDAGIFRRGPVIYVDNTATGLNTGISWDDAFVLLDDALDEAIVNQEVQIAAGDYPAATSFRPATGVVVSGGFGGETRLQASGGTAPVMILDATAGVELSNVTFSGAHGASHALSVVNPTAADNVISTCRFVDNDTEFGAIGIGNGHLILRDSTFENNSSSGDSGAAINCHSQSSIEVSNCEFRNNRAAFSGGAIHLNGATGSVIDRAWFSGNQAPEGGGAIYSARADLRISNSVLARNQAGTSGSAIALGGTYSGTFELINCTTADHNTQVDGSTSDSTLFVPTTATGSTHLVNSVLLRNVPVAIRGQVTEMSYCLLVHNQIDYVVDTNEYSGAAALNALPECDNMVDLRPRLTEDYRLLVYGPVYPGVAPGVDAGNNARLQGTLDLAGNPRLANSLQVADTGPGTPPIVDLGAYELPATLVGPFLDSGQQLGHAGSNAVALGDLNADGTIDAFIAARDSHADTGANEVWLNNGAAVFTDSGQRLAAENSADAIIADLNGDGHMDAFVANDHESASGAPNRVWFGNSTGTLVDSGQRLASAESYGLALGDINGDGHRDAVVASGIQQGVDSGANELWLNDGSGTFSLGQTFGNSESTGVALADLDGDGDLDAFIANVRYPDTVWRNDAGTLVNTGQQLYAGISRDVALGDVDGDGHIDAVIAVGDNAPNQVWLNDGNAAFVNSGQALGSSETFAVQLGDLNRDGALDAFFGNGHTQADSIWYNDGHGVFVDYGHRIGAAWTNDIGLADLDGDGDLDAYLARGATGGAPDEVWINNWPTAVYVDHQAPGPIHDGLTWETAYPTIQEGVDDPRAFSLPVHVATGVYPESVVVPAQRHIRGGFDGATNLQPPADQPAFDIRHDGVHLETLNVSNVGPFSAADPVTCTLASDETLRITACRFVNCSSLGGAVSVAGGTVIVRESLFADNRSEIGSGGALNCYTWTSARLEVYDTEFYRNWANYGGAINCGTDSLITRSFFSQNQAPEGGAIYAENATDTLIDDCRFQDNIANWGGAIFYGRAGTGWTIVQNSSFARNHAGDAMAIGIYQMGVKIYNCTFLEHDYQDGPSGRVPVIHNSVGTVIVGGCLLTENLGSGLISSDDQTTVVNCTLSANDSNHASVYANQAAVVYLHNSIIYGNQGPATFGDVRPLHSILNNPDPLFENGYRLAPDSPAIDAGDTDLVPPDLRKDLDGRPRRIRTVDIGAYEAERDCTQNDLLFHKAGTPDSHFGHAIARDGRGNFIIGARGTAGPGEAFVLSAYDGHILHHLVGENPGDRFGRAVAGNGQQIFIGAPQAQKVYVYDASSGDLLRVLTAPTGQFGLTLAIVEGDLIVGGDGAIHRYAPDGTFLYDITRGGDFGYAIASFGDGIYAVSAMQADRVTIYHGTQILFELHGQAGEWFGRSLAAAGDANNDGVNDILVGAALSDTAYLYSGADGTHLHTATGGIAVSTAGDTNSDGFADFATTTGIYSGLDGSQLAPLAQPVTTLADLGFGLAIGDYHAATCEVRTLGACSRPPVIAQGLAISASCNEDTNVTIPLDISGANPVAEISHGPANGTAQLGPLVYTPAPDFNGQDRLFVRVTDDADGVAVAEVVVTVRPINDPPEATTPPSFTRPVFVGDVIQPSPDVWTDDRDLVPGTITLSYQWLAADSATGDNTVQLPGEVSLTYSTDQNDLGRWLAIQVTATDNGEGLPATATTIAVTDYAFVGAPLVVAFLHPPTHLPAPVSEGTTKRFYAHISGGVPPYTYTWHLDGALIGNDLGSLLYAPNHDTVPHPDFTRDLQLTCSATDIGAETFADFAWTVRVSDVDRLPPAPTIAILPAAPRTRDTLSLAITDPIDPDGDNIVGYDITWRLLAARRDAFTAPTLNWQHTAKGQTWQATALPLTQPYDGLSYAGNNAATATTFIHNTAPTVASIGPLPVVDDVPQNIQLLATDPDLLDGTEQLHYQIVDWPLGLLTALNSQGLLRYTPVGAEDTFSYRVRDNEGEHSDIALVLLDVAGWGLVIDVTGARQGQLTLGTHPDAKDVPTGQPLPVFEPDGFAGFLVDGQYYQEHYQPDIPGAEWTLHVDAQLAQVPILLSWDGSGLPADGLYLDDPAGSLHIDMAQTHTISIQPGETRTFRLRYARVLYNMVLRPGWNMISLPIAPIETQLDVLFPAPLITGWAFEGTQLITTNTAELGRVYWILSPDITRTIPIEGSKAPPAYWQTSLTTTNSWNIFPVVGSPPWGPRPLYDLVTAPGPVFPVIGWDPIARSWRRGPLLPGRGYFGYLHAP